MAGAERWLTMQAQSNSRYPRASHDSFHAQELDENRTPPSVRRTAAARRSQALNGVLLAMHLHIPLRKVLWVHLSVGNPKHRVSPETCYSLLLREGILNLSDLHRWDPMKQLLGFLRCEGASGNSMWAVWPEKSSEPSLHPWKLF